MGLATFYASLRAVGTAATMAFVGFYMHRKNFVTPSGKKMLALLSQQVTIPAFLFAKIIFCPRDKFHLDPDEVPVEDYVVCPSVANRLNDVWILLIWPFFVVPCGLLTGYIAARMTDTPKSQIRSCLVSCAFGNSTGLAITLLTVIHDQFRATSELGSVDSTAFLSIYLLLYPVLQWGVGGWLMAPPEKEEEDQDIDQSEKQLTESVRLKNVINDNELPSFNGGEHAVTPEKHGPGHNDHGLAQSFHLPHLLNDDHFKSISASNQAGEEEFGGVTPVRILFGNNDEEHRRFLSTGRVSSSQSGLATLIKELSFVDLCVERKRRSLTRSTTPPSDDSYNAQLAPPSVHEDTPLIEISDYSCTGFDEHIEHIESLAPDEVKTIQESDLTPLTETLHRVMSKVLQPPVIAALTGLFIASFPQLRGVLVSIWASSSEPAPLQWMFDGIHAVGQAAVPINMTILGINLSSTSQNKKSLDHESKMLPNQTMIALILGKMIVMPFIGISATWFLQRYILDLPDGIDSACYLVMMIVFITPTANNVMVMVELSGSSSKEGMARLIGYQYLVSPVVLSLVLSQVVTLASCHFDKHGDTCSS